MIFEERDNSRISTTRMENEKYLWAILRLGLGWIMFWAFLDKLFGFGFATPPAKAWLGGGSPTLGFLKASSKGPLAPLFQAIAGHPAVDWLFMMGLLLIGLALILGIGVRIAGYSGALMMMLMYAAAFIPPANNPILDDHFIYAIIFLGFTIARPGNTWGLGQWWTGTALVKKFPILE